MSRVPAWGAARFRAWLGAGLLAAACGPFAPAGGDAGRRDDAPNEATAPTPDGAPPTPAPTIAEACRGAGLVGPEVIADLPADVRLAVVVDLRAADLGPALDRVEAWAEGEGARIPVVAQLALQQLGFQVRGIAGLLRARGLELDALALLIAPGGESIWLWQIACDAPPLGRALEAAWDLRIRALAAGGMIAEPRDPAAFPFDVLLAAGDRMALVPAGKGTALLRWLGRVAAPPLGASATDETPPEVLARLGPAAVRLVIADRSAQGIAVTPSGEAPIAGGLRVTGEVIEIDGSVPP